MLVCAPTSVPGAQVPHPCPLSIEGTKQGTVGWGLVLQVNYRLRDVKHLLGSTLSLRVKDMFTLNTNFHHFKTQSFMDFRRKGPHWGYIKALRIAFWEVVT